MTDERRPPHDEPRTSEHVEPSTENADRVYEALSRLGISFERHEHAPVATVDDGIRAWAGIDAAHCKNLFLRNQKGDRHYLLIVAHTKRVDLRAVAHQMGDGKLSFGSPERLLTWLGVAPGAVSPCGLINDTEHHVRVFIDRDLKAAPRIAFHPNDNTRTIALAFADFERFLADCTNPVTYVDV